MKMTRRVLQRGLLALVFVALIGPGEARATPSLARAIIGKVTTYRAKKRDSLPEIARRFDLGFNEITDANPEIDPFAPQPGALVIIPAAWIPPVTSARPAIVVNLAELRLYFYPLDDAEPVTTFPLGIGDEGKDTPLGKYQIIEKIVNPTWYVPASIRRESPGLPRVVPPGTANPMGTHALRLSRDGILIHGTNKPWGIGRRSSHGCLRLYPEDITRLFNLVRPGSMVEVVNERLKIAAIDERVYLEVHRYGIDDPGVGDAMHMLADAGLIGKVDFLKVVRTVTDKSGVPVDVSLRR